MTQTLVVMLKEPRPGRVKTRLGRDIGMIPAAWWFRHQCARLLRDITDPRWRVVLAVAPDSACASPIWPSHLPRLPQGRGDLGQRMIRVMQAANSPRGTTTARRPAFSGPAPRYAARCPHPTAGPVCLIGADVPGITRSHIARAFATLGNHDATFGPADDGGYWLIGFRHPHRLPPTALQKVRWSTHHALTDSLATLPNHRIALIDQLRDVDTAADLIPEV